MKLAAHPEAKPNSVVVGLILVNHYNCTTKRCDPSISTIASQTNYKEKTVVRAIKNLEEIGLIHRLFTIGIGTSFKFPQIRTTKGYTPPKFDTPPKSDLPPPNLTSTPPKSVQKSDLLLLDKTVKETVKKITKKNGIDYLGLPEGISLEAAQGFVDHRKLLKTPLTQRAFDLAMKTAAKAQEIGLTPDQAIDETVAAGWKGINLSWLQNRKQKKKNGRKPDWATLPYDNSKLWNHAKKHGLPDPGRTETEFEYRSKLTAVIEQRLAREKNGTMPSNWLQ